LLMLEINFPLTSFLKIKTAKVKKNNFGSLAVCLSRSNDVGC